MFCYVALRNFMNPFDWFTWGYGKFFANLSPLLGWIVVCSLGALLGVALSALVFARTKDKYQSDRLSEIEFLPLYQAASPQTPNGGVDVAIWWIPVRLSDRQKNDIPHAGVRLKLHNAHLINHDENQKLWWIDKEKKFVSETILFHAISTRLALYRVRPNRNTQFWLKKRHRPIPSENSKPSSCLHQAKTP